jgi:pimeloyl-ACP methyl ester carboxylesterase
MDLHWEERGELDGPTIVAAMHFSAPPTVFEGLWADLGRDHRIVTYDLRGLGQSVREGPYDMDQDVEDLGTVIEEAGAAPATVIGFGDGANRAVRLAAKRPDLVSFVIGPGGNPLGRQASEGTTGLAGSEGVLDLLQEQISRDYRGALRNIVTTANPEWDDDTVSERIELNIAYCPQDTAAARLENWVKDDSLEQSRAVGDRLWVLSHPNNPWFPPEGLERTHELAPEARVILMEAGPVSRPDLHANVIREATGQT